MSAAGSAGKEGDSPGEERDRGGKTVSGSMVLNRDGSITIIQEPDENGRPVLLEAVKIPTSWRKRVLKARMLHPGSEDWAFIQAAMKDIPDKERERLIDEARRIISGTSTIAKDEQDKVLEQVVRSLLQATEGDGPNVKFGCKYGHLQISTRAGNQLGYVTTEHVKILVGFSGWGDQNRREPFPEIIANRHSCVLGEWGIPLCDNYGRQSLNYFLDQAKAHFALGNVDKAYECLGISLHYIEDLGCPFHTTSLTGQIHHSGYESWISSNWRELEPALEVRKYYHIGDPLTDSEYLAWFSNQRIEAVCDIMRIPGWKESKEAHAALITHTKEMFVEIVMMTIGMLVYATTVHSPQTAGNNKVQIPPNSTCCAHIDTRACSKKMFVHFSVTQAPLPDLEIWLGIAKDPSSPYTEMQLWDHQGGDNTPSLDLTGVMEGFEDINHWRLRIKNNGGGKKGCLEEFRIQVG